MKKKVCVFLFPIAALILELLPYGAVLNFGHPAEDGTMIYSRATYSYFDLTPFGYANSGPFLTAMLTCALLLFAVIFCIRGKIIFLRISRILTGIAVFTSIMPLFLGIEVYSIIGLAITILLLIEFIYLVRNLRQG